MSAPATERDLRRTFFQRRFYAVCRAIVHAGLLILYRVRALNLERVPKSGPLLIVGNHESFIDPPLVAVVIRTRHIHFLARATLFRNRIFGWIIHSLNASPIEEGGKSDAKAIRKAVGILESGEALLMFPEAARSLDGKMQPFKRGAAVLIKRAACPVLPVGISGAFEVWPRSRSLPKMLFAPQLRVAFGEPIQPDDLFRDGPDEALRRLEREIAALVEQASPASDD